MSHWTTELFVEQGGEFRPHIEDRLDAGQEQVDELLDLLEDTYGATPDSVLDVACGVGRHLVPFAEAGLEAHGVDISPEYVAAVRKRADDAGVADRVIVTEGDMRDLDALDVGVDLVTSFWTSVGYFDRAGNEAVFEGMYDRLVPGGVVAVECSNKEGVLSHFAESEVTLEDGSLGAERREYDPETSRMESTLHAVDVEAGTYEESLEWNVRLYAPVDLRERLADAGFEDVAVFAGFDGEEITRESARMVALGRKPS